MAKGAGQVTLRGRFPVGASVRLVKVAGEHVLRSEPGDEEIAAKTVEDRDGAGYVRFSGVEVGARYLIVGQADGFPLEVRVTGRSADDEAATLAQAPIQPDRVRMSDGSFADEAPTKESAPGAFVGPGPGQHQVPEGTLQRSDTPRGSAHPLDPEEAAPKRRQDQVPDGAVQMSDTRSVEVDGQPVAGQEGAELVVGAQRQEDVPKGVLQRSDTPTGVATPVEGTDAVAAQQVRESSLAKESRGEPGKVAASPLEKAKAVTGADQASSEERAETLARSEREAGVLAAAARHEIEQPDASGLDAQGQPLEETAARAAGITPAKAPAEAKSAPKRPARKRAAKKPPKSKPAAKPQASKAAAKPAPGEE